MALTLVTGPANAEKAGHVLGELRLRAREDPILVVPTAQDADRYRRELAEAGLVFGARVERFGGLLGEIAGRTGADAGRPPSPLVDERLAARAAARTGLDVLAASAATPGFPRALVRLREELAEQGVDGARLRVALRAWSGEDRRRRAYGEELATLVGALDDERARLGRPGRAAWARAVLDALRLRPAAWGATPVLLYGFDDLAPGQLDAVEALARACDVTVALTFEAGRAAFAGRAGVAEQLRVLADRHVVLAPGPAAGAQPELHHLERTLFEGGSRMPAGAAIALLEGGGEREALGLAAARAGELLAAGMAADELAVVLREPGPSAWVLEQAFRAEGVPVVVDHPVPARATATGRAVLALLRAAAPGGGADDVVGWLRAPGLVREPALVDRLEEAVRREGLRTAAQARGRWAHWDLDVLDAVASEDPRERCARLEREVGRLVGAPWAGTAPVFGAGPEALELRAGGALRRALGELGRLSRRRPDLVPAGEALGHVLGELEVRAPPAPGAVLVTRPQRLRARRVRALLALGLQEGAWPAPATPDPFLGDAERRALNRASGLRLRLREDRTATERLLFYEAVTRPTELLLLGWHAADEDGEPTVRSPFVDDVADRFEPGPPVAARPLGAGPRAPAPARPPRLGPIAPLRAAAVLAELRDRPAWSATALEAWAACPVRWFVERHVRPEPLEPDPEPLRRGGVAHEVLEAVLGAHRARHGPVRPRPEHLGELRAELHAALARLADGVALAPGPERHASARRRLEVDLLFFLERLVVDGSAYVPAAFEHEVDVPVAGGAFRLTGTIDRVDTSPDGRRAIIYDYKGRTTAAPQAAWLAGGRLQLGLYARALPAAMDGVEEVVGALYQPIGADDPRPRGAIREDADPGLATVGTDRLAPAELEALLDAIETRAAEAVRAIRRGDLEPRPQTCGWRGGGCTHPSICRCER